MYTFAQTPWPIRCFGCGKGLEVKRELVNYNLSLLAEDKLTVRDVRNLTRARYHQNEGRGEAIPVLLPRDGTKILIDNGLNEDVVLDIIRYNFDMISPQFLEDLLDPDTRYGITLSELIKAYNQFILPPEFVFHVIHRSLNRIAPFLTSNMGPPTTNISSSSAVAAAGVPSFVSGTMVPIVSEPIGPSTAVSPIVLSSRDNPLNDKVMALNRDRFVENLISGKIKIRSPLEDIIFNSSTETNEMPKIEDLTELIHDGRLTEIQALDILNFNLSIDLTKLPSFYKNLVDVITSIDVTGTETKINLQSLKREYEFLFGSKIPTSLIANLQSQGQSQSQGQGQGQGQSQGQGNVDVMRQLRNFLQSTITESESARLLFGLEITPEEQAFFNKVITIEQLRKLVDDKVISAVYFRQVLRQAGFANDKIILYLSGHSFLDSELDLLSDRPITLSELKQLIVKRRLGRDMIDSIRPSDNNLELISSTKSIDEPIYQLISQYLNPEGLDLNKLREVELSMAEIIDSYLNDSNGPDGPNNGNGSDIGVDLGNLQLEVQLTSDGEKRLKNNRYSRDEGQTPIKISNPTLIEKVINPLQLKRRTVDELSTTFLIKPETFTKPSVRTSGLERQRESLQIALSKHRTQRIPNIVIVDVNNPLDDVEKELLIRRQINPKLLDRRVKIPVGRRQEFSTSLAGIVRVCCTKSVFFPPVEPLGYNVWNNERLVINLPASSPRFEQLMTSKGLQPLQARIYVAK